MALLLQALSPCTAVIQTIIERFPQAWKVHVSEGGVAMESVSVQTEKRMELKVREVVYVISVSSVTPAAT